MVRLQAEAEVPLLMGPGSPPRREGGTVSDEQIPPTYEELVAINQRMATRLGNLTRDMNEILALSMATAIYRAMNEAADELKAEFPGSNAGIWLAKKATQWKPIDPRVETD